MNIESVWKPIPDFIGLALGDARDRAEIQQSHQAHFNWNVIQVYKNLQMYYNMYNDICTSLRQIIKIIYVIIYVNYICRILKLKKRKRRFYRLLVIFTLVRAFLKINMQSRFLI